VHGGGELAAEGPEVSVRRGEEREKVVLVLVAAASHADIDAGAVIERRHGRGVQSLAVGGES
jgi:hypothetical protein